MKCAVKSAVKSAPKILFFYWLLMNQAVGRLNRYNAKSRLIVNLGVFNFEYTFFLLSYSVLNVNDKINKFLGLCDVRKIGQFFASY